MISNDHIKEINNAFAIIGKQECYHVIQTRYRSRFKEGVSIVYITKIFNLTRPINTKKAKRIFEIGAQEADLILNNQQQKIKV